MDKFWITSGNDHTLRQFIIIVSLSYFLKLTFNKYATDSHMPYFLCKLKMHIAQKDQSSDQRELNLCVWLFLRVHPKKLPCEGSSYSNDLVRFNSH